MAVRPRGTVLSVAFALCGLSVSVPSRAQTTPAPKEGEQHVDAPAEAAPPPLKLYDFTLHPLLQVRARGEWRHDPVDAGGGGAYAENAWDVFERTRLGLGVERGALAAQVTLQDTHLAGISAPTAVLPADPVVPRGATGLYEGYVEIHTTSPDNPVYLRLGRQAITWGDGRLLGNADFSPVARTFDAARGHATYKAWDFEAFGAVLDAALPLGTSFDDFSGTTSGGSILYGAMVGLTLDPLFHAEVFGLARTGAAGTGLIQGFQEARQHDVYTVGARVAGDHRGWKYGVTGAAQLGSVTVGGASLDRLAYAFAGDASHTFSGVALMPSVRVGGAFASGGQEGGTYAQFDPLYPDVATHYGLLDATALSNVIDGHAAVRIAPTPDVHVALEYHYTRLATHTGDWLDGYLFTVGSLPAGTGSLDLGHELDVTASWRPWPALTLAAGYAGMLLGDGAKAVLLARQRGTVDASGALAAPDFSHYVYLQATLDFPPSAAALR